MKQVLWALWGAISGLCLLTTSASAISTHLDAYHDLGQINDRFDEHLSKTVSAGGHFPASRAKSGCNGFVDDRPTVQFLADKDLISGSALRIDVFSAVDTTVLVLDPNGTWYCADDEGVFRNPSIDVGFRTRGIYKVWVGTYKEDAAHAYRQNYASATVWISNGISHKSIPLTLDPGLKPEQTVAAAAGFSPDPLNPRNPFDRQDTQNHRSGGGPVDLSLVLPGIGCVGYVNTAPMVNVIWSNPRGQSTLYLFIESGNADGVMVVHGPDGVWRCDDDDSAGRNPGLGYRPPRSGTYKVWSGHYNSSISKYGSELRWNWSQDYLYLSERFLARP